jgi:SP family general alpha glucoside:H+ symporter-like MFS transporter
VVGQALEGIPWGFFIANSPAYASEIVPLPLRAACTATLQMSWFIGSIIVAGATYAYNGLDNQWSWRVRLALQWIFPVRLPDPLTTSFMLIQFYLVDTPHDPHLPRPRIPLVADRRGRKEEALRSIKRLGAKTEEQAQQFLAMIERAVEIEEEQMGGSPTLLDLVKGTDRRQTTITCLVYASQNFAGNLIANQATYFFERVSTLFLLPSSPPLHHI